MSDRDTISRLRSEFVKAFNEENIEALSALVPDDHVGMPPNRPAIKGKDATQRFWREGFALASSRVAILPEELVVAGDVAIDQFHWTMDSTPRPAGATVHDEGKCLWIWRRQPSGEWKVARAIWNSDLATAGLWSGAARAGTV